MFPARVEKFVFACEYHPSKTKKEWGGTVKERKHCVIHIQTEGKSARTLALPAVPPVSLVGRPLHLAPESLGPTRNAMAEACKPAGRRPGGHKSPVYDLIPNPSKNTKILPIMKCA